MNAYELTADTIKEISKRYYGGEKATDLVKEYDLDIRPNQLYKLFPPIESAQLCEYCNVPLVMDAPSKERLQLYGKGNGLYCPKCHHRPDDALCRCEGCQKKRLEAKNIAREKIIEKYGSRAPEQRFSTLSFREKVYLGAQLRLLLQEDMYTIEAYNERGTDIPLAPTEEMMDKIYETLFDNDIILVDEHSDVEAFVEGDQFPSQFYVYKVMYRLGLVFPEAKNDLFVQIFGPTYFDYDTIEDAYAMWVDIATEECIEYLQYQLDEAGFGSDVGQNTRHLIRSLLDDFATAQIFSIIWRETANAAKYYLSHRGITKTHAANICVHGIRTFSEKALNNGWDLTKYNRPYDMPQSEVSTFFFNKVTRLGDNGFTQAPSRRLLEEMVRCQENPRKT